MNKSWTVRAEIDIKDNQANIHFTFEDTEAERSDLLTDTRSVNSII